MFKVKKIDLLRILVKLTLVICFCELLPAALLVRFLSFLHLGISEYFSPIHENLHAYVATFFATSVVAVLLLMLMSIAPYKFIYVPLIRDHLKEPVCVDNRLLNTYINMRFSYEVLRSDRIESHKEALGVELKEIFCKSSVLKSLHHPNLLLRQIPDNFFYTNLKDCLFEVSIEFFTELFNKHFTVMAFIMTDILKGVQYLHDRNIYHLNLEPKNILIIRAKTTGIGCTAKIGGFTFAKRSVDNTALCQEVGLKKFRRPPECFLGDGTQKLNAAKVDSWGVGITAYEMFTGGMLTVQSVLTYPPILKFTELMNTKNVMDRMHFVTALEAKWMLRWIKEKSVRGLGRHIHEDCWYFTRNLLMSDPEQRCTIQSALSTPLVDNIRKMPRTECLEISTV